VTNRPLRPLAIVALLALGDYLLWNWSVSGNHDALALVAGVTLIPLLIALVWLTVLAVAHLFALAARRSHAGAPASRAGAGAWPGRTRADSGTRLDPPSPQEAARSATSGPAVGARQTETTASPSSQLAA